MYARRPSRQGGIPVEHGYYIAPQGETGNLMFLGCPPEWQVWQALHATKPTLLM
jgi:hypothetical protein